MRNSLRVLCLPTNALISIALAWEHKLLYFESGLCLSIFWEFTPDLTSGVLVPTPSRKIFTSIGSVNQDCFLTVLFFSHLQALMHRNVSLQYLLYLCPARRYRWGDGWRERDRLREISPKNWEPPVTFPTSILERYQMRIFVDFSTLLPSPFQLPMWLSTL